MSGIGFVGAMVVGCRETCRQRDEIVSVVVGVQAVVFVCCEG